MLNVSQDFRPLGAGAISTIYFTVPTGATFTIPGISPSNASTVSTGYGAMGDSIHVTGVELEDTGEYCQ